MSTLPSLRGPLDYLHERRVYGRRTRVLAEALAGMIPRGARVLDVGCGDGVIDSMLLERRPDLEIEGVDILVRPAPRIPVRPFDGRTLPHAERSVDVVMLVDVLHHADEPASLLKESARVARQRLVIKDHLLKGVFAGPTLRFMDWVGNVRHGVEPSKEYWEEARWRRAFDDLGLEVVAFRRDVPLYPWYASWIFGRSLHFIAALDLPPFRPG